MTRPGKIIPATLKNLFSKPATVSYPAPLAAGEKPLPATRGKVVHNPELCIGCNACMRDCPAFAITIIKVGDKQFKAIIKQDDCVYCGQCVDSCPKEGALVSTNDFELAALSKEALWTDSRPDMPAWESPKKERKQDQDAE